MDAENIGPGSESFQVNPAVVTGSRLTHLISYVFPSHRPRWYLKQIRTVSLRWLLWIRLFAMLWGSYGKVIAFRSLLNGVVIFPFMKICFSERSEHIELGNFNIFDQLLQSYWAHVYWWMGSKQSGCSSSTAQDNWNCRNSLCFRPYELADGGCGRATVREEGMDTLLRECWLSHFRSSTVRLRSVPGWRS